ncbi:hypothetical protein [Pseudaestuariivita rosea]|uniref:hypothetical protein n=1 Tax=Pseudaestuariivita rosea TaxID=2763263 RepID=UPI001ABAE2B8|nr:hypothetical protein [Pseudaestuariivita rosea]
MRILIPILVAVSLSSAPVHAECYADYKAKQDNPLRLHYGVAELRGDCSKRSAESELTGRLRDVGWQLLNVLSVFDENGLGERKDSAGEFFLRY